MKKVLLIILVLLIAVVVGLGIYVGSIDWNEHKGVIAKQFNEATGKEIVFAGPVTFKILPTPYLSATNVKIMNPTGGDKPLVEIRDLVANLSLAPLLKGQFDVQRMELRDPVINFEVLDDGRLNWQSELEPEQRRAIEESNMALNSVSLGNATVNFEDPQRDIAFKLENLNGEIVAQGIMGPYRIEGNYIKDNVPEGFALSLGKLSDSFATTLNLVVTHPMSESYVRFDGSFMLTNKVLNGNMIVEAKKLRNFWNANIKSVALKPQYDYPLALTADISLNSQQLSFSNMVVKYGDTQGAGTVQMPFNDGFGNGGVKPRIDAAFNFTDLDLTPAAAALRDLIAEYANGETVYDPELEFDMLADVKSVRTSYKGQPVKNFEVSLDFVEGILTLNNLSATVPGDTDVKLKGTISALDDEPFYILESSVSSNDFLKTLTWLDVAPEVSAASTYRKAVGNVRFSGTPEKIQIAPFKFTLDKSTVSGEAGIKRGARNDIMLVLNTDMINFDNYIGALPSEESEKGWAQRMAYRFSKLGFLNDFDMQFKVKMDVGIYEKLPFEKVDFQGSLLGGKLEIEKLQIGTVANSKIEMNGQISGFGQTPVFEGLNYDIATDNLSAFISQMAVSAPDLDYKTLHSLQARGALNGNLENFATRSDINLGNLAVSYSGQVDRRAQDINLNGELEIKHPDFARMLADLGSAYSPQGQSLGLFNLQSTLSGNIKAFRADPLKFNIGFNTFDGNVSYEKTAEGRPSVLTNLEINKFEIERFLNQGGKTDSQPMMLPLPESNVEFLAKPQWSKDKINYDFYRTFDMSGNFKIQDLSFRNYHFRDAETELALLQGVLDVRRFEAGYLGGSAEAALQLQMTDKPLVSGRFKLNGAEVSQMKAGGAVYALNNGIFNAAATFSGAAESPAALPETLKANVDFDFANSSVKGWNLQAVYDDLIKREDSTGLAAAVKTAFSSGNTSFGRIKGRLEATDGQFMLADTVMNGTGVNVTATGSGSLPEWNMDVLFNVKYAEPRYLPGYGVSFKGAISAPQVDVDVSALFELYKSRQDKKDADIKAAADAEKGRLKALAAERKKVSEALLADIYNHLEPDIREKQRNVFSDESQKEYVEILRQSEKIAADLKKNSAQADSDDVDENMLNQLENVNVRNTVDVEQLRIRADAAYLADLKKNVQAVYNQVVDGYNRSKMLSFDFNTARDGFNSRLAAIETDFKLEDDGNISGWHNFIDDKIQGFESQDKKLLDRQNAMQKSADVDEVAQYLKSLQSLHDIVETDLRDMQQSLNEYKDYANSKVAAQESAYAGRLRQAEVKRKLEENTGSISIKKSGRTVTVRRDIEEIEKAEELTNDHEVKVLDFSRPKLKTLPQPTPSSVNVVKKGRVKAN